MELTSNTNSFEIREVENIDKRITLDFFVNQEPLSKLLGIDRFDWSYCSFDLDVIEIDKTQFPNYDREEQIKSAVSAFLGKKAPINQFGTHRIVLYRCHCGCDYCGIISFELHQQEDQIIWKDITYEDDVVYENDLITRGIKPIEELIFDRKEYVTAFENYLVKYCS